MSADSARSLLASLPSVSRLLAAPELEGPIETHGHAAVVEAIRDVLAAARRSILAGEPVDVSPDVVSARLRVRTRPSLRRVLNATGVVLHTNLGRAPLSADACAQVLEVARGYSTLELDLSTGERGSRHAHIASLLSELLGAEDAIAVNNGAGAILLALAATARGREVIVARGELVEIGGGFRIPEVMAESGAHLVEVGTTNKVHLHDYERAIRPETGAILHVHRSNFAIVGFASSPSLRELAGVARTHGIRMIADLGSGLAAHPRALGAAADQTLDEPRPKQAIADGVELVSFSGDKLLGGPQAGIIAGRKELVERSRSHPLARALRIDKLSLAALEATLRAYRDARETSIPIVAELALHEETLAARAERIARALSDRGISARVVRGESLGGGGSLPLARLPTWLVSLGPRGEPAQRTLDSLRSSDPPVIGRIINDQVVMDPRTLAERELDELVSAVIQAIGPR
ncbi:MAG: L-seryl-tRNA(Sec) selenium transferase [Deltaproteobacteria bacterium]|nr:L-seryl-tRNA(Sec) selenium transferase [Deltaproteobacteria bacterium]